MLADRVSGLYAHTGSSLVGNALGALIVAALFYNISGAGLLRIWFAAFVVLWLLRLALAIAYHRSRAATELQLRAWRWRWNAAAMASGALWGVAAWSFYGHGQTLQQIALVLIVNGMCIGSIPSLATQGRVYLVYVTLALLPLIVRIALGSDPHGFELAGIVALVFVSTLLLGRNFQQAFEQLVQLQSRSAQLNEQLREEKAAAEQARREAEAATQAKTRFFAAASHDLRQPLQALGLFTETLRQRNLDSGVKPLIDSVAASVNALDALFTELLDITRLDSGGLAPRPRDFAVDDILGRLRLHFEPLAFDKGLALRLRGGRHVAHADPLLVERILRNLTSNAIRYTQDGGVLVAARRRGDNLLLQVWDSGIGIHPSDQARVFDEFVQLGHGGSAAESSTRPGLGLGLAIVRRLAALLRAPLQMRSVPGRGTVFSLTLPRGR